MKSSPVFTGQNIREYPQFSSIRFPIVKGFCAEQGSRSSRWCEPTAKPLRMDNDRWSGDAVEHRWPGSGVAVSAFPLSRTDFWLSPLHHIPILSAVLSLVLSAVLSAAVVL